MRGQNNDTSSHANITKFTSHTHFLSKFSEDVLQKYQDKGMRSRKPWIQHGIREVQSHRMTALPWPGRSSIPIRTKGGMRREVPGKEGGSRDLTLLLRRTELLRQNLQGEK